MYRGLFGLTATEEKLLEPLPPPASLAELSNRLDSLQQLRSSVVRRRKMTQVSAFDVVRYQAELTRVNIALESTVLRLRVPHIIAERITTHPLTRRMTRR